MIGKIPTSGTVGTGSGVTLTAKTYWKKISTGDYYRVTWNATSKAYEFCKSDGTTILNNQSEASVIANVKGGDNDAKLADGVLAKGYLNPVAITYQKNTANSGSNEELSDVAAWNTVVFNWDGTGADAKARFGTASAKADLGKLIADGYLKVTKVETAASDPFYIVEKKPTGNGDQKYTIKQRVGTLTPGTSGTINITVIDCFNKETVIKLTYSIR